MNQIVCELGQLVAAEPALTRLLAVPFPAKVAYHIAKLARLIQAELPHFHQQREALIRELGEESDGGITVSPANIGAFALRMNELVAVPVTLAWEAVPFAALGDVSISAGDFLALGPLVVSEEPAQVAPAKKSKRLRLA